MEKRNGASGRSGRALRRELSRSTALVSIAEATPEISRTVHPLTVEWVATSSITPNPRNPRHHSARQISQLAASIKEFGCLVPPLLDERNILIAGHGRWEAVKLLGLPKIPIIRVGHLTEVQKRAYLLADNRLAEHSVWNPELLKVELAELGTMELPFDIEITGFDTVDIDRLMETAKGPEHDAADDLPQLLPDDVVSRPGDLWLLDEHRLFCGDATHPVTYAELVGRDRPQMMFTDPPYNVPIRGHVSTRNHREFLMASGEMPAAQFVAFLERTLRLAVACSEDGAIHYVCIDWRHFSSLIVAANPVYGEPKQLCVWVKDNAGMGSFYRSQHELVVVFKAGMATHINNFGLGERGRYRTNVWRYAGATSQAPSSNNPFDMHPTVKPVALVMDAIKDCSRRSGLVLDPFGGSGTTLVAAERTGRRAALAELDPAYVDLSIRRWQLLTGDTAKHGGSGRSFADVAAERAEGRVLT